MASYRHITLVLCAIALGSGFANAANRIVSVSNEPDNPNLPATAKPNDCFAHDWEPAVIETITEKTPIKPARLAVDLETGETTVIRKATFKTVTVQRMVKDRTEIFFQTLCPQLYSERFVQSLQRALKARGFYSGNLTGWMDDQTNLAVKLYQRQVGINSGILALAVAEEFGLTEHSDFEAFSKN